jgi:Zn-dependent protease with chaperone function
VSNPTEQGTESPRRQDANNRLLAARIKEHDGAEGITFLSGNEANLDPSEKALLTRFDENARRMGIHPAPTLFMYEKQGDDDSANAFSSVIDGVYVVGISQSMKKALEDGAGGHFMTSALDRLAGIAAHEEGHVRHDDMKPNARGQKPGLESVKVELAADKDGVRATCNPQAMEDGLTMSYLAEARAEGVTVGKLVLEEAQDSSDYTHPLLPTRIAHLEYLKEHPPRGCKRR